MSPLIYYICAAVGGAILSWLLLGNNKSRINQLELESRSDKAAIQELLSKFNVFSTDANNELRKKTDEINKLKRTTALPEIITSAQEKEIKHWKAKASKLEASLKESQASIQSTPSDNNSDNKRLKKLEAELDQAILMLQQKETQIREAEANKPDTDCQEDLELAMQQIATLKKQRKKCRAKVKQLKAKKSKKEIIEIRESINLEKLSALIQMGELTTTKKKSITKKQPKAKKKKNAKGNHKKN